MKLKEFFPLSTFQNKFENYLEFLKEKADFFQG